MVLKSNGAVSLCITSNYESHALIHTRICRDLHFAMVYGLRTNVGGSKFSGG